MKVLILPDKLHWAYHAISKALKKYNHFDDLRIKIMHIKGNEKEIKKKWKKYDRILVMGWQTFDRISFLDRSITLVGIHSFHSWDDRKTTPEKDVRPPRKLIKFLSSFRGVNAVSKRLTQLFCDNGVENIHYTANGVDTEIFRNISPPPIGKTLVVGYSGSKAHDWRKGVSQFIIPAAKKARVKFRLAMLSTDKYIPLEKMYKFYNEIDCYICASSSEGMSLSVLEAASCGRPIIATKVSGNTEIVQEGKTGFFVVRNVADIADRIRRLKDTKLLQKMSGAIEKDIRNNWCWSKRAASWLEFLRKA